MLRPPYVYFALRGGIGGVQKKLYSSPRSRCPYDANFLIAFFFFLSITDSQPIRVHLH